MINKKLTVEQSLSLILPWLMQDIEQQASNESLVESFFITTESGIPKNGKLALKNGARAYLINGIWQVDDRCKGLIDNWLKTHYSATLSKALSWHELDQAIRFGEEAEKRLQYDNDWHYQVILSETEGIVCIDGQKACYQEGCPIMWHSNGCCLKSEISDEWIEINGVKRSRLAPEGEILHKLSINSDVSEVAFDSLMLLAQYAITELKPIKSPFAGTQSFSDADDSWEVIILPNRTVWPIKGSLETILYDLSKINQSLFRYSDEKLSRVMTQ